MIEFVNKKTIAVDETLTKKGWAADAEAVGKALAAGGTVGGATEAYVDAAIEDVKDYVDEAVAAIDIPEVEVNLDNYYTKTETDTAIENSKAATIKVVAESMLPSYATKQYVNDAIKNIDIPEGTDVDLSNYYTKNETEELLFDNLGSYATNDYMVEFVDAATAGFVNKTELEGYATEKYVDDAIANIPTGGGGTGGSVSIDNKSIVENENGEITVSYGGSYYFEPGEVYKATDGSLPIQPNSDDEMDFIVPIGETPIRPGTVVERILFSINKIDGTVLNVNLADIYLWDSALGYDGCEANRNKNGNQFITGATNNTISGIAINAAGNEIILFADGYKHQLTTLEVRLVDEIKDITTINPEVLPIDNASIVIKNGVLKVPGGGGGLTSLSNGTAPGSVIGTGGNNEANAENSFAFGSRAVVEEGCTYAIALGGTSNARGVNSFAAVCGTAQGGQSVAIGNNAFASGEGSVALGYNNNANSKATGFSSFAVGGGSASGTCAFAMGYNANAGGTKAVAFSNGTASASNSIAFDSGIAAGVGSFAGGTNCRAVLNNSIALGNGNEALSNNAVALGNGTKAKANAVAMGKWNIEDGSTSYAFTIGKGTSSTTRSNAFTVSWTGAVDAAGKYTTNGADYAEYFEWADGNPNGEDRIGLCVALEGNKIRLANTDDDVLGIISGTIAILGDNYASEWQGKYLTDEFGRIQYEMVEEFNERLTTEIVIDERGNEKEVEVMKQYSIGFFPHPIINPNYDETKEYIPREERKEWDAVGMMGKLYVIDDGSAVVGGYVAPAANGVVSASTGRTNMRVMERTAENIIRVCLK